MSDKVRFKKARGDRKIPRAGEWCFVISYSKKREPAIGCPNCGCHARLDHEIAADGTITPSIVCPFKDCDFHNWGVLEGWKP